jgi:LPXTG-motif cell wall-anchored protein
LGSLLYVIIGAVIVVAAVGGLMFWRRKVASDYGTQAAK